MSKFENVRNIVHVLLSNSERSIVNLDIIEREVDNALRLYPDPEDINKEELVSQLKADFEIYSNHATQLLSKDIKPWLYDSKVSIEWKLWGRYKSYLRQKDSSISINTLDDETDKILDKCVNPKTPGSWDRRGMVVGNVQSGKTSNYTGLINKATDAGYKLVIVIAGIHNSLRKQTQERIDEGYIGRNSADLIFRHKNNKVGVGKFSVDKEIFSYTSSDDNGDFSRSIAAKLNVPIGGNSPTILVIKKNKSILENLILWLAQFAAEDQQGNKKIFNVPALVIDDEADNASVNSGNEFDVRTINRLIRTLLNLFDQNTFIGYTATPYANLFIPSNWSEELETMVKGIRFKVGEDLFPRDFIINIHPPSNYIGAVRVFGYENEITDEQHEGLDIIRKAEDQEPYFPKKISATGINGLPDDVPASLREAIRAFILVCAIRRLRKDGKKHNSMLVHVALRVAWIDRIAWLVNEIIRDYKRQIRSGQGSLMNELEDLYMNDFVPTTEEVIKNLPYSDPKIKLHPWEEVKNELLEAVTKIEVRAVHGTKKIKGLEFSGIEELNYKKYENGLSVIAVGGNKLARGITLEGLSVSYYLRTSRMYDSLMQMGRWFGYRPGYVDLCRLYTTGQLINWYRHITMATEEMRADFDDMAAKNLRPEDFQLKVRTHPGMLLITSVTRMKDHERIQVSFSGKLVQTYIFEKSPAIIASDYKAFTFLLSRLSDPIKKETDQGINALLWTNVSADLISDFIAYYHSSSYIRTDVYKAYIEKQALNGKLTHWSVAVILNSRRIITSKGSLKGKAVKQHKFFWQNGHINGGLPFRNFVDNSNELMVKGGTNTILDKKARMIDLEFSSEPSEQDIKDKRRAEKKPLLVIMPLDPRVSADLNEDIPLIGFGLAFPEFEGEEIYEYAARPIHAEFEEVPQEDDDIEDDE